MGRFVRTEKVLNVDDEWLMRENVSRVAVRRAR
jgi:hypothetical protein